LNLLEINGFQPGSRDHQKGREPYLGGSRVDILFTQVHCIWFIRDCGCCWVMVV